VRWEWLRRTDPLKPWQGLNLKTDSKVLDVFQSCVQFILGDGRSILFWKDRWIQGRSIYDLAPAVVEVVPTRRRNSRTASEALINNAWIAYIPSDLMSVEICIQCVQLWEVLDNVERNVNVADQVTWKGTESGVYTAKSTYNLLCQGRTLDGNHKQIWKTFAPLKCKIFIWLALKRRLWTADRRFRHGLAANTEPCYTCLQAEDTVDHILVHCPHSRVVWHGCLREFGLGSLTPQYEESIRAWWDKARGRVRKQDRKRFDTLVILASWTLWKQRNARVFGNTSAQRNSTQIVTSILEEFKLWETARVGGRAIVPRE
jgi:hypothetical protein